MDAAGGCCGLLDDMHGFLRERWSRVRIVTIAAVNAGAFGGG